MKLTKYILTSVISFSLGSALALTVFARYTSPITNIDIVSADVFRATCFEWSVSGRLDEAKDLSFDDIEKRITRIDYHSEYPDTDKLSSTLANSIENTYKHAGRVMPKHVQIWIAKHKH